MTDRYQTLQDNQEEIIDIINFCREKLYNVLVKCFSDETNRLFNVQQASSLIFLCQQATHIQSVRNINSIYPPAPTIIDTNSLYGKQKNIQNKIQYCNNLLRYALRKNGIDFGYVDENNPGCNETRELIRYIEQIESVKIFNGYIEDVSLTEDGDLLVTSITVDDIENVSLVTSVVLNEDDDIDVTRDTLNNIDYNDVFLDISLNRNGDVIYTQVGDDDDGN